MNCDEQCFLYRCYLFLCFRQHNQFLFMLSVVLIHEGRAVTFNLYPARWVIFDCFLQMKSHINAVVKSCNCQLREIGKIRQYLTLEAATNLIHAFVSSRLDYGNSLLFGLPDTDLKKLQKVQNTAARILTRTGKYDHISPVLGDLHWLLIKDRIDFKILLLTYKSLNDLAPPYLLDLLQPYESCRALRSENQMNLKVPKTRLKSYGDRAFSHAAPKLWNKLPLEIKSASTLELFKSKLKTHMFSSSQ